MPTTSAENILKRLEEANDTGYYESIFKWAQSLHANNLGGGPSEQGTFKSWPDLMPKVVEVGVSTPILTALLLTRSKVLKTLPIPEFPQVSKRAGEIRKAVWERRAHGCGYGGDGHLLGQIRDGFMDGAPYGAGFVQFGPKTNPKTGYQYTHGTHVPLLQMMWERTERSPARSRWFCAMKYLPMDIAEDKFGFKKAHDNVFTLHSQNTEKGVEVVRVFEYWDLGWGIKGDPTIAYILGDIYEKPISVEENWAETLPFAFMEMHCLPNKRRPMGMVPALMQSQEALRQMQRKFMENADRRGFDMVNADRVNPEDMERVNAGESGVKVRVEGNAMDKGEPFWRVPGGEIAQSDLTTYQELKEEFRSLAGVSELEQGSSVSGADTLGEVELVDQRTRSQSSAVITETAHFARRCVEKFAEMACKIDNDPLMVDALGTNLPLNAGLPDVPDEDGEMLDPSSVKVWFKEPSTVTLGEEALFKGDTQVEQQQRQQILASYANLAGALPVLMAAGVDPTKYMEEVFKAGGDDPKEWLTGPMLPMGQPGTGAPGEQTGQPQPGVQQVA
jgi:hypothetical protein